MTAQSPNKPRIPEGARVKWQARYDTDPVNEGVVLHFSPAGERHPKFGWNIMADVYVVLVDKTPAGNLRKTPKEMRPYASRLEAQNPDLLK